MHIFSSLAPTWLKCHAWMTLSKISLKAAFVEFGVSMTSSFFPVPTLQRAHISFFKILLLRQQKVLDKNFVGV